MATNNTNWDSDDDDDQTDEQQTKPKGGGLRAHAEQVKRENEELKNQLAALQAAERKRTVATALASKGFPSEVAEFVPDSVASDETALEKWLTEKEKVFKPAQVKTEDEQVNTGFDDDDESMQDIDAWGRISRVNSASMPASKASDTMAAIQNAKSREELEAVLRKFGNQNIM